jgi:hypothetical protein
VRRDDQGARCEKQEGAIITSQKRRAKHLGVCRLLQKDCFNELFCVVIYLLPSLRLMSLLMSLLSWPIYGGASLCVSHCSQQPTSHACAFCSRYGPVGSAGCLQIVCSLNHNTTTSLGLSHIPIFQISNATCTGITV